MTDYGEDFNRKEAIKILKAISKSYNEANGKSIIKGNTEIVGASDSQLWKRSSVPYLIDAVEKALYSGMSASEIEDDVLNASDNIPFQPEGGNVAKQGDLAQNNIARHLARSIPSEGRSDKELNIEYTKFKKDFIPEDWDDFDNKLKKDGVPTAQRQRILTHLKDNWSGDDGIKQTVLDGARSKLTDGTATNSMELLAELAPYEGIGAPNLKNLSMFLVMPEMSDEEMLDSMVNFSSESAAKQEELKAASPPATTEATENGEMGPSQAGAGAYDPSALRTVYEQDRDGNWVKGQKTGYGANAEWVSPPTLVGKDKDLAAIASKEEYEAAIYARNRADNRADYEEDRGFQRRDVVTQRTEDLTDIENLYTRQDENYARDLAQDKTYYDRDLTKSNTDYVRDIAREDAKQKELNARYDIQRNQDMKRADLIMLGQWTRDDEVAYRNREWNIDDRRDDRLWDEAQQAENRTFQTGQLAMQMGPQYFQSQLDAAEFEKDVLSNASDYIASAFMQRGEASPFKAVTQADLINGFRAKARDMMQATEAGFRPDIGDPAEFAKGVVQSAGVAKGNAASTVGAALEDTYNPEPPPGGGSSAAAKAKAGQAAKIAADKAAKLIADAKATADALLVKAKADADALLAKGGSAADAAKIVADAKAVADAAKVKAAEDAAATQAAVDAASSASDTDKDLSPPAFDPTANYESGYGFTGGNEEFAPVNDRFISPEEAAANSSISGGNRPPAQIRPDESGQGLIGGNEYGAPVSDRFISPEEAAARASFVPNNNYVPSNTQAGPEWNASAQLPTFQSGSQQLPQAQQLPLPTGGSGYVPDNTQEQIDWNASQFPMGASNAGDYFSESFTEESDPHTYPPASNMGNFGMPSMPNVSIPNMNMPNVNMPSMNIPNIPTGFNVPNMSMPNMSMPNMSMPNVNMPEFGMPNFSLPEVSHSSWPSVNVPNPVAGFKISNPLSGFKIPNPVSGFLDSDVVNTIQLQKGRNKEKREAARLAESG